MKLKDWADKQGISYLTAWRWFKAGDPRLADAYQSDSGTIIVPDDSDSSEQTMGTVHSNDVMSTVLKKTVEFSKNNSSVEDFAAWILSNFSLRPNSAPAETPKYSRQKPKPEEVQNHFKQFLKPKGEKPKPNMFVTSDSLDLDDLMAQSDDLTTRELVDEIQKIGAAGGTTVNPTDAPEMEELMKDLSYAISTPSNYSGMDVKTYENIAEGVVMRSVDLTPQPFNYTGSSTSTFSNNSYLAGTPVIVSSIVAAATDTSLFKTSGVLNAKDSRGVSSFQPTSKEIEGASRFTQNALVEKPRRGRKSKKQEDK